MYNNTTSFDVRKEENKKTFILVFTYFVLGKKNSEKTPKKPRKK